MCSVGWERSRGPRINTRGDTCRVEDLDFVHSSSGSVTAAHRPGLAWIALRRGRGIFLDIDGENFMRTWQTGQVRPVRIGRRRFSIAALALLGGAVIAIGCGGGSNHPTSPTATPSEGQNIGFVEGNHPIPHVAVISAAQLSAGNAISLNISNGSHSHTVSLTGAQVMQIAGGVRVSVESSTNTHSNGADPHAHTVTFN
jgi:hypothetical protein